MLLNPAPEGPRDLSWPGYSQGSQQESGEGVHVRFMAGSFEDPEQAQRGTGHPRCGWILGSSQLSAWPAETEQWVSVGAESDSEKG